MRDAACMRLATSRRGGGGPAATVSEHVVKTRPGATGFYLVVVHTEHTESPRCTPSLFSAATPPPPPPPPRPRRAAPVVYRTAELARSFDYCFVKCNVKDSTITPICPAAIVPAIKAVVLALVRHCSLAPSCLFSLSPVRPSSVRRQSATSYPAIFLPPLTARCFSPLLSLSLCCSLESREGPSVVCANSNLSPGHVPLRSELRAPGVKRARKHASLLNPS